ncbi:uncharacterized protein PRCAT00005621001 [Priceomyces carsonii]|uniref:uncharacterized protein n=1 Tax=Priceomyces carsonii TaxID=28549 RepID=UPI002EDB0F9F|nr:unnamed protein product [Priceomyces carsonii]
MTERNNPDSKYRARASKALSHIYEYTSGIAENHIGESRGIAAGTAASIIGLGLERVNKRSPEENFIGIMDEKELDEFSNSIPDENKSHHFMDRFMEKLLKHAITDDGPEKDLLEKRIRDPDRTKKPNLSIKILASNFKKLSSRMSEFFVVQYGLIHILTWRKPTKTLSFLVLYTSVCLWPHLVLAYPLLFLLFGVLIPGYLHRHPMKNPELIKVKRRGQSLLSFLNESPDQSIISDILNDDYDRDSDTESLRPLNSRSSDGSTSAFTQPPASASSISNSDNAESSQKKDRSKYVKSQMTLAMNMRDLQNLTTDVLSSLDAADKFWYDTAGFKDERLSTFIFYGLILATSAILLVGYYVPWRLIFIQSGWVGITLCHPKSKKYLVGFSKTRKGKKKGKLEVVEDKLKKEEKRFDRRDIIIDDPPEIRFVEVFEIELKSILNSSWTLFCFSNSIYDPKDHIRCSGKRPKGVDHLSKILPPSDWRFDFAYANKWKIDFQPKIFLHQRLLDMNSSLRVYENESDGWIYDDLDYVKSNDTVYEFRRRRLSRECYRYSRAAKEPKR